jgi:hypothetical protein
MIFFDMYDLEQSQPAGDVEACNGRKALRLSPIFLESSEKATL